MGPWAVVGALFQRNTTGEGQHVDVSMLGATLGVAALQTSEYFGTGNAPKKLGSAHPRNAPYQAFKAQDDYFGMAAGNNSLWHHVCDVVGRADLKEVEKYSTPTLRAANQVELKDCWKRYSRRSPCPTGWPPLPKRACPAARSTALPLR